MKSNGSCHGGAWEVKLGRWSASVMFPEGSGCQDLAWLEKAMVNTGQGRGEAFMEGSSGKDQGGKDVNCCYCFSRIQANAMTFHFFFFFKFVFQKAERLLLLLQASVVDVWQCIVQCSFLEGGPEDRSMHFLPKDLECCFSALATSLAILHC